MTFETDHIRLKFVNGSVITCYCQKIDIEWPPPETFMSNLGKFKLLRRSQFSDEEMAKLPDVARGAEYEEDISQTQSLGCFDEVLKLLRN